MRLNVWISFNSLQEGPFTGVSFPYVAKCPSTRKKVEFKAITDVYDEIIRLSDAAESKGFNVGQSVYEQSFFFVDHAILVNNKMQNRIREFQFCKQFSCPPYPSLQETPYKVIEQFSVIEEEYNSCLAKKQKEKTNA